MPWLSVSFELGALDPQYAEEALFAAGALSVTLSDAWDHAVLEPAPGEVRLWPQTRVCSLFASHLDPDELSAQLSAALSIESSALGIERLADRVWEREWLKDSHAMRFGQRLWICPQHREVTEAQAHVVRLDPGLAFGTGTHASTALCLEWLDAHLARGAHVIDYGCGSGILALAAAVLGADSVQCFDIDPQALLATQQNAARNGCTQLEVLEQAAQLRPGADVLLANILSETLCTLAPQFARLVGPRGQVVLAGILREQAARVTEAFSAWFDMCCFGERADWVGLAGTVRKTAAGPFCRLD